MFLTAHSTIGLFIATTTGLGPVGAFFVSWLAHYLGDLTPHGDEWVGEWARRGKDPARRFAYVGAADAVIAAAVIGFVMSARSWSWVAPAVFIGSSLPDALFMFDLIYGRPLWRPLTKLHRGLHAAFGIRLSAMQGFILQGGLVSLLVWMMIR